MPSAPQSARARFAGLLLRTAAAIAALSAIAALLAGCGSSQSSGTDADPASVVPASAPLFAGATVRPSGSAKTAALAAGQALSSHSDPYLRLLQALQTPGSPALDYGRDVAPWLGPHAGIFLSSIESAGPLASLLEQGLLGSTSSAGAFPFGAGGAQGAIVLDTSDAAKARSFLHSQAQHAGAHASAYRGVTYEISSGGVAFGLVDRFAVIGSESGMHGVIDTTLGGAPLTRASGYSTLLAAAPSEALAHLYSDEQVSKTPAAKQGVSALLTLLSGPHQTNISLVPSASSVALDADALAGAPEGGAHAAAGSAGGVLSSSAEGAQALGELPGDSWLAVGLGHAGATLGEDVAGLRELASLGSSGPQAPASGFSVAGLLDALLTPLSALAANDAQARSDYASWMGSAGIFASGSSLLELKAAVVIDSSDAARSRAAVGKLAAQLRAAGSSVSPVSIAGTEAAVGVRVSGLPIELDIAAGHNSSGQAKFVLGLGEASVTAALSPSSAFSGSPAYRSAASALGEGIQPSLSLEFPTLLSMLEGAGLSEDPTISKFVPYLRNLTTLAGGGHGLGGGVERYRLVLGLRQAG